MLGIQGDPTPADPGGARFESEAVASRSPGTSASPDAVAHSDAEERSDRRLRSRRVPLALRVAALALAVIAPLAPIAAKNVAAAGPVFTQYVEGRTCCGSASPQGMAVGSDGNLWIADSQAGQIERLAPAGVFTKFPTSNADPQFVTLGSDGNIWFTEGSFFTAPGLIGRMTPSGTLTEFPVPTSFNKPYAITTGADGNVWFTEDGSKIGRVTPAGVITEFPIPTQQSLPDDIAPGPDGNVWFGESLSDKVASISPAGKVVEYQLPSGAGPEGLVTGPDKNLWIVEGGSNNIGRLNVTTHTLTEYPIPSANSNSNLITVGPDGALYFTESRITNHVDPFRQGKIGRITTGGAVSEFAVPNSAFNGRNFVEPFKIISGPGTMLWFTEEVGGIIVSMTVPTGVDGTQETGSTTDISRSPQQPPPVAEYSVPERFNVAIEAMTSDRIGNVWFTESQNSTSSGSVIGRLTPQGQITELPVTGSGFPTIPGNNLFVNGHQGITTGPDGAIYFCAGYGIIRVTTSGVETDYTIPSAPNSCNFIVTGGDGNLWYTQGNGVVGRFNPTTGAAMEFPISNGYNIGRGPDGDVWVDANIVQNYGQDGTLRRIAPDGTYTDFPVIGATPTGSQDEFAASSDGKLWFTASELVPNVGNRPAICRLVIATDATSCFIVTQTGRNLINSIVAGPQNSIWFDFGGFGSGPSGVGRMTLDGTVAYQQLLPAGFSQAFGMTVGASPVPNFSGKAVYVAEFNTNRIAVLTKG